MSAAPMPLRAAATKLQMSPHSLSRSWRDAAGLVEAKPPIGGRPLGGRGVWLDAASVERVAAELLATREALRASKKSKK